MCGIQRTTNDLYCDILYLCRHFLLQAHLLFPDNCYHMKAIPFMFRTCSDSRRKYSNRAVWFHGFSHEGMVRGIDFLCGTVYSNRDLTMCLCVHVLYMDKRKSIGECKDFSDAVMESTALWTGRPGIDEPQYEFVSVNVPLSLWLKMILVVVLNVLNSAEQSKCQKCSNNLVKMSSVLKVYIYVNSNAKCIWVHLVVRIFYCYQKDYNFFSL